MTGTSFFMRRSRWTARILRTAVDTFSVFIVMRITVGKGSDLLCDVPCAAYTAHAHLAAAGAFLTGDDIAVRIGESPLRISAPQTLQCSSSWLHVDALSSDSGVPVQTPLWLKPQPVQVQSFHPASH